MRLELDTRFLDRAGVVLAADDLKLGLSLGIITPSTVVALAKQSAHDPDCPHVLQRLATVDSSAVSDIRQVLGATDPEEAKLEPEVSVRKWLYLELLATYEIRDRLRDPLEFVEYIYADFGYPESVAPFVRYMPLPEGEPAGVAAMTERWLRYLSNEARIFGPVSHDDSTRRL